MKVLCDVHIAKKVCTFFQNNGIESVHVNDILDSWYTSDNKISEYADTHGYTVVSKDKDFKNSHLLKKGPKRLLSINLGNISTTKLIALLEANLDLLKEKFKLDICYLELGTDTIIIIE